MSDTLSIEDFDAAFSDATNKNELSNAIEDARISVELLKRRALEEIEEITASVGSELSDYSQKKATHSSAVSRVNQSISPRENFDIVISVACFLTILASVSTIISSYNNDNLSFLGFENRYFYQINIYGKEIIIDTPIIFIFSSFIIFILVRLKVNSTRRVKEQMIDDLGVDTKKSDEEAAFRQLNAALRTRGMIPVIRKILNEFENQSYALNLGNIRSEGLSETYDADFELRSTSRDFLETRLKLMAGGCVGVAGPRGVGKTTLLRSLCNLDSSEFQGKNVLSVYTTAPVQYNGRDFLLHLFSKLCQRVCEREGFFEFEDAFLLNPTAGISPEHKARALMLLQVSLVIGIMFILYGVAILLLSASNLFSEVLGLVLFEPATDVYPRQEPNQLRLSLLGALSNASAVSSLLWGGALTVASLAGSRLVRGMRNNLELEPESRLARIALEHLKLIKFQQTYTSGWSGSLKLPIGITGGLRLGKTAKRETLSLPEITERYRNFLRSVAERYYVILAIDELDKIDKSESAEEFVNEVKSIFGIAGCTYLISISNDAMSQFERRGMPLRSAFDSALDDIVIIDHLNISEASLMMKRRIVGLPDTFLQLAYCFSGGLARDLIRMSRRIFEMREIIQSDRLSKLSLAIVLDDLKLKTTALEALVHEKGVHDGFDHVIANLRGLNISLANEGSAAKASRLLEQHIDTLSEQIKGLELEAAEPDQAAEPCLEAAGTSNGEATGAAAIGHSKELLAILLFYVVIVDLFALRGTIARLKKFEKCGLVERVARAKRGFSISLNASILELRELREAVRK